MSELAFPRPKMGDTCFLLVPKIEHQAQTASFIKGGSAIVTAGAKGGDSMIYFEGNLFEASNLNSFIERAQVAYGRLVCRYPTVAMMMVNEELFEVVGTMTNTEFNLHAGEALSKWLSLDEALLPLDFGASVTA